MNDEKPRSIEEIRRLLDSPAMQMALSRRLENADGQIDDAREYPAERVQAAYDAFMSAVNPKN